MFAKWVFRIAGIYGLVVITPLFFLTPAEDAPAPAVYYTVIGIVLAFQVLFLVISLDPPRFRAVMPVCILEKIAGTGLLVLYLAGSGSLAMGIGGAVDLLLAILFALAYLQTPRAPA